jgi:hypothetical protein
VGTVFVIDDLVKNFFAFRGAARGHTIVGPTVIKEDGGPAAFQSRWQAMDQLYNNDSPAFTTWVVENDLLKEPFVVIDVGVQGGPHPRWKHLKDKVRVYGFDAIPEVVEGLNAQKQPNETYFATALGDEEGTRDFYVRGNGGRTTEVPFTRVTHFSRGC